MHYIYIIYSIYTYKCLNELQLIFCLKVLMPLQSADTFTRLAPPTSKHLICRTLAVLFEAILALFLFAQHNMKESSLSCTKKTNNHKQSVFKMCTTNHLPSPNPQRLQSRGHPKLPCCSQPWCCHTGSQPGWCHGCHGCHECWCRGGVPSLGWFIFSLTSVSRRS